MFITRIHKNFSHFLSISGLERPTISHLLQAAYLFWQQTVRGIPKDTALVNSFSDVYIKPRCGSDFASNLNQSLTENKNSMLKALENITKKYNVDIGDQIMPSHTLTVKGLCNDSAIELAKQVAYIAIQETKSADITHKLISIFNMYQKSNQEILDLGLCEICLRYIAILPASCPKHYIKNLILNVAEYAKTHKKTKGRERFYPELFSLTETETTAVNKDEILLYAALKQVSKSGTPLPNEYVSVISYSKAVLSGNIADNFEEYPILKHCDTYLTLLVFYITAAIKSSNNFDDTTACKVLQLLNWYSRFRDISHESIFISNSSERKKYLREDIVPLLTIHSKWLHKHLMPELFKYLPNNDLRNRFNADVAVITNRDDQENKEMIKLSKHLNKLYGRPKQYECKQQYEIKKTQSAICKKLTFDPNQPLKKQLDMLSLDGATASNTILQNIVMQDIDGVVMEAIKKCEEVINPVLLPVPSYIIQRALSLVTENLHGILLGITEDKNVDHIDTLVLKYLVSFCKVDYGFPPALLNLLEEVLNYVEDQDSYR